MKILVCISATPDTTSRISFKNNDTEFNAEGVQYILNPYDEWYALVKALEIKEAIGGSVTVIHVGPASHDAMIRKALAIGADDAVRINGIPSSTYSTAFWISAYAKGQAFDLILLGKETIDYQTGEVGAMLAELLDRPYVPYVSKLAVNADAGAILCDRDIEGGVETIEAQLPLVVSASKGLAEQRIPNMKGIMTAKSKPLSIIEPTPVVENVQTVVYTLPATKKGVTMIAPDQMEELVRLLHEKEKAF